MLEAERKLIFKEAEDRFIGKIRSLEEEIEEVKQIAIRDIRYSQQKSEEGLA